MPHSAPTSTVSKPFKTQGKPTCQTIQTLYTLRGNEATLPSVTSAGHLSLARSYFKHLLQHPPQHLWDQGCFLPVMAKLGCQLAWVWNQLKDKALGTVCRQRFP